jgi:hypothetical protein
MNIVDLESEPTDRAVAVVDVEPARMSSAWADERAARVIESESVGVVLHLDACGPAVDVDIAAVDRFLATCARAGLRTVVVAVDEELRRRLVAGGIDGHSPVLFWAEDALVLAGASTGRR